MKMILTVLTSLFAISANAGGFAAIAISPSGHYGEFHGANSRYQAEANAVAFCGQIGCRAVGSVENGYLVLAMDDLRQRFGTGWSVNPHSATQIALNMCGPRCRPVIITSAFW